MKKFNSENIKDFVSKSLFDEKVILNKDSSWPKISIVTPSYNQGEFLERIINKDRDKNMDLQLNIFVYNQVEYGK
jgi:hypothetical protein